MISDDTLMGTSLMTFPVQGTGWFGPGNFTAVKQKKYRLFVIVRNRSEWMVASPLMNIWTDRTELWCSSASRASSTNKTCSSTQPEKPQ